MNAAESSLSSCGLHGHSRTAGRPTGVSRLHGSRRLFATLKTRGCDVPVIHHLIAPNCPKSELALQLGMQVGAH